MIFDADDLGADHVISNMCQAHDCRDVLIALHEINPKFKATLFAIPAEMTLELLSWCKTNRDWISICVHGFFHSSNYECEKMSYDDFGFFMRQFDPIIKPFFEKGFKAPGWQISDDVYRWLLDNDWWVADKDYNDSRRPNALRAYVNGDGNNMRVWKPGIGFGDYLSATHHHTWNCVGNGVYEQFDYLKDLVQQTDDWKFVSEVIE